MLGCPRLTSVSINVSRLLAARKSQQQVNLSETSGNVCGDSSACSMVAVCSVSKQVSCSCNHVISLLELYWGVDMVQKLNEISYIYGIFK